MTEMLKNGGKKKKGDTLTGILALFVLGLFFSQLILGVHVSTIGKNLNELSQKAKTLEEENIKITEELAVYSSLANIASKAAELGFSRPREILWK